MELLFPIPETVRQRIAGRLDGDEPLVALAGDLDPHGRYADTWLVATRRRVFVVPPEGEAPSADDHLWFPAHIQEIAVADIQDLKAEALVGCWRLLLKAQGTTRPILYYTGSVSPRFTEAAAAITRLAREGRFVPSSVEDDTRCRRCGELLPERGSNCPLCVDKIQVIRRILGYLRPYRRQATLLALCSLAGTLLAVIPPLLIRALVDGVLVLPEGVQRSTAERLQLLVVLVGAMVLVRVLMLAAELAHRIVAPRVAYRITYDIRRELFERLEFLSLAFYDRRKVGAIMSRLTNDATTLQEFLCEGVPFLLNNLIMLVGILVVLLVLNARLAVVVILPAPLMVLAGWLAWRHLWWLFHQWWVRYSGFSAYVNEALTGIRITKAFAQESQQLKGFDRQNQAFCQVGIRADTTWGVIFPLIDFVLMLAVVLVWGVGGYLIVGGDATIGDLTAFISYLFIFYHPLQWFTRIYQWMQRALTGAERIFDVIDTTPETAVGRQQALPRPLEGRVAFEKVSFGYDKSKPVLHDIDFVVQPGEMIGLVGKSGAGKSTLIKLLARFYLPDHGRITVDGVDLAEVRVADLREQIGLVPQEPFLFDGTIAENIAFGRPDATLDEIIAAARAANAHEFICQKPDGYDTRVGEGGKLLSTGEKQRVSIARAILRNPRLLILDEATSAVDSETEKQIQEALARLVQGRTTFAIAHRLSTLRNAHRLIVLDEGRLREMGTHDELLSRPDSLFAKLVEMQQEINRMVEVAL